MAGVAIIVLILIIIPDQHQSASFVFTKTLNTSGLLGRRLLEPGVLVRLRDRTADGPVHDHRLRRLGAPQRGDEGRGARRGARHRHVGRRLGRVRLHPAGRRHVRRARRQRDARRRVVRRAVHLADGHEHQVGRVHARHRVCRAAVLRRGLGDLGLAHAVRVLARRRRARAPAVAQARARAHAGLRRRWRSACSSWALMLPTLSNAAVGYLVGTSIAVIGLYLAFVLPIILRWRLGDRFEAGSGRSASTTSGSTRSRSSGSRSSASSS